MITIVYAHPSENSHNATIRKALGEHLKTNKQKHDFIDLYKDCFNPALSADELKSFFTFTGESSDPLVKKYQVILKETTHLVFMFPIWFNDQPAILKGFFERTCLPGFAFTSDENGIVPLLTHVRRLTVLTTSGAPTETLTTISGNMIQKQFINNIVQNLIGHTTNDEDARWFNLGPAVPEALDGHIAKIKERFQ